MADDIFTKKPGELIKAADWNAIQAKIQSEIRDNIGVKIGTPEDQPWDGKDDDTDGSGHTLFALLKYLASSQITDQFKALVKDEH